MAKKNDSYLGGSTILAPYRKSREAGWQPQSVTIEKSRTEIEEIEISSKKRDKKWLGYLEDVIKSELKGCVPPPPPKGLKFIKAPLDWAHSQQRYENLKSSLKAELN